MQLFKKVFDLEHEQVIFCVDKRTNLKCIIAIHNTVLGPSLGGCRLLPYTSESEAIEDVLRLSRGMSYKAACAGLALGGGKAVIVADPKMKTECLLRTFGRFVESLKGRYITAEDMNMTVDDMDTIRQESKYVVGVSENLGGSGNPSPLTALGTYHGIKAAVRYRLKKNNLKGVKVSIQGVGSVGEHLCGLLIEDGAQVYACDTSEDRLTYLKKKHNVKIVDCDKIYDLPVDVFSPCARGAIVNDETLKRLKCKIIAGAANNQLEKESKHSRELIAKKILYAPDYVISAGGLIHVYYNEISRVGIQKSKKEVFNIGQTLFEIFKSSEKNGITTREASDLYAERRIKAMEDLKTIRTFEDPVKRYHS